MTVRIYVGNLPYQATEEEVRELFGQHGATAYERSRIGRIGLGRLDAQRLQLAPVKCVGDI